MLTSNKNINKIELLQKKAVRLFMGLPRTSHTAKKFWALNILPFRKLKFFNVIQIFFFNLKEINYPQHLRKISHYQKISKTQVIETEMNFIFLD